MTAPCKFVQISDMHLLADRRQYFHSINPYQTFLQAIEQINHLDPTPDFVLMNGDLVNEETVEVYEVLADAVRRFRFPVYYALGNHDNRALFRKVIGQDFFHTSAFCSYTFTVRDYGFVVFDSLKPGHVNGAIAPEQLQWCRELLDREHRPTLLFLHHAPLAVGIPWLDELKLENASEFLTVVDAYPQVQGVFFGHVHGYHYLKYRNVPFVSSPALSVRFGLDPETKIVPGPPGFLVVTLDRNHLDIMPHFF